MKPGSIIRAVRPTDNLAAIAEMYAKGLGFTVLAQVQDHRVLADVVIPQVEDAEAHVGANGLKTDSCWGERGRFKGPLGRANMGPARAL